MSNNHNRPLPGSAPFSDPNPQFTPQRFERVQELISHYPQGKQKSAILPVLHLAQEQWGWLPVPVMDYVAGLLSIQPIEVYEVATFYTMFHLNPVGKYVLEVCRTGPCCLNGAEQTIERIKEICGIEEGETSADGMFTLKPVECLAACGMAPVVQVRNQYFEHVTPEKTEGWLNDLRARDPQTVGFADAMPENAR